LSQRFENDQWINPLLSQLKLIEMKDVIVDPRHLWEKIEENHLLERISKLVAEINTAAGNHILEMLEFLPPQKKVLVINFGKNGVQHKMEVTLENEGIFITFGTAKRFSTGWERYFSQNSRKDNYAVAWEQAIHPAEILSKDIQNWFTYLLSGLNKKFRPDLLLSSVDSTESGLSATLRKASA